MVLSVEDTDLFVENVYFLLELLVVIGDDSMLLFCLCVLFAYPDVELLLVLELLFDHLVMLLC